MVTFVSTNDKPAPELRRRPWRAVLGHDVVLEKNQQPAFPSKKFTPQAVGSRKRVSILSYCKRQPEEQAGSLTHRMFVSGSGFLVKSNFIISPKRRSKVLTLDRR